MSPPFDWCRYIRSSLNLGFSNWATATQGKPTDRLFPLIHPKGSPLPSLWFTRLLRVLAVKRPAVSLHSLSHTLATALEKKRTHPSLMRRLLGHALGNDVESRVYLASVTYTPKELAGSLRRSYDFRAHIIRKDIS